MSFFRKKPNWEKIADGVIAVAPVLFAVARHVSSPRTAAYNDLSSACDALDASKIRRELRNVEMYYAPRNDREDRVVERANALLLIANVASMFRR